LQDLVQRHWDRYPETADLNEKRDIVKEIVAGISNIGRFLKRDGDRWIVLSEEKALAKTAQALRYRVWIERNTAAVAGQVTAPSQNTFPEPTLPHVPFGPGDPPDIQAQKTLEMYSQWMV
jgi:hypothetical protein